MLYSYTNMLYTCYFLHTQSEMHTFNSNFEIFIIIEKIVEVYRKFNEKSTSCLFQK